MDEVLAQVLRLALPLVLATLAEVVAERAGIVNLGIEGTMLAGALAAVLVAAGGGPAALLPALVVAVLVGASIGALTAVFVVNRRADQIVTGTAVHFSCLGGTALIAARFAPSGPVTTFAELGGPWPQLPLAGALLLVVGVALFLGHTSIGTRLRAAGEDPEALIAAGGSAVRSRWTALLIASSLSALAGASLTTVLSGQFVPEMTHGRGFLALGLVLFARWRPVGALIAGLFLGAAFTLELQLSVRAPDVASGAWRDFAVFAVRGLPYILTIAALAVVGRERLRPPAALGRPHRG